LRERRDELDVEGEREREGVCSLAFRLRARGELAGSVIEREEVKRLCFVLSR
jgi:hypothetical protein